MLVCPWTCLQGPGVEGYTSPVAASKQESQDFASGLVLFFR